MRSNETRTKTIQIRVTVAERKALQDNANKAGYDLGDYLRRLGLNNQAPTSYRMYWNVRRRGGSDGR